jgi:arylsulfatase A-like enzyme
MLRLWNALTTSSIPASGIPAAVKAPRLDGAILAVVVLCALIPISAHRADTDEPTTRLPNVVVILADDLGYGDVSAYGQGRIRTPAIDRLARQGMRLTNGYSTASTCTPSRYSIMTGEYPWRKRGTGILPGDAPLIILPSRLTLPRVFKNAGYVTGAVGKWHLGLGNGHPDFNEHITPGLNELGFDYSFIMAATGDRVPTVYVENGRVVSLDPQDPISVSYTHKVGDWPTGLEHPELLRMRSNEGHLGTIINGIARIGWMTGGKAALWNDQTLSDTFNAHACEFIRVHKNERFFLYYAAHEPHVPRDPNPRFAGKSGVGARGDAVVQFDDEVARLMATLKEQGLENDTLVILSSDNGPAVADGYDEGALPTETKMGHHANGILRGGKYSDYEGGVRMPFIASWPGHIKGGTTSAEVVSLVDLVATAAALTGQRLAPADAPDSFNMLPTLTSGAKSQEFVLFGNPGRKSGLKAAAIREGRWKLIVDPTASGRRNPPNGTIDPQGFPQLFDLDKDPRENTNVAQENPKVVARLTERLEAASAAGFTRPGAEAVNHSAARD